MDPRADRRELTLEHVPASVELKLGAMIVVGRPHRADDGDLVDARADVRPPVADLDSGLAAFGRADLKRIEPSTNVELRLILQEHPQVAAQLVLERVGKRGLGDRLSRVAIERGLGSKLSRWLVPPIMNSQMTFFALGVK